ncbi:MAG: TonB-dependent receptor [Pseudohongiellaceae bacterium]
MATAVPWTNSALPYSYRLTRCALTLCIASAGSSFAQERAADANGAGSGAIINNDKTVIESISVAASRHRQGETLISEFVKFGDLATANGSIAEALALQPGVSLNGQPGLFQTLNIRGLAKQRVQSNLNGMRLTSERRAGVSASFIDPLLLSGVEVIQGPASTYYGSGALAGVLQLLTREDSSSWLSTGYSSNGNERNLALGSGSENYSTGFALRSREDGTTAQGMTKHDRFTQLSGYYSQEIIAGDYRLNWQLLGSRGEDIGKDNSQFPQERTILYPEENHLLSQLKLSGEGDWSARVYAHYQDLTTKETRPTSLVSEVENRSLDIGFTLEDKWQTRSFNGQYGVDYFGRRGVEAVQEDSTFLQQPITRIALNDGEENESALFATLNRDFEGFSIHAGTRWTYFTQKNGQAEAKSQNKGSYFFTFRKPLGNWDIDLSYGTSTRFASLTERLFSGTTGRGRVIGNSGLQAEDSAELDIGLRYQSKIKDKLINFEAHRFSLNVDNFIERIVLDDTTLSFRNLANGDIEGWQYQLMLASDTSSISAGRWRLQLSGQGIAGEDAQGNALIDIPPNRHQFDAFYETSTWSLNLSLRHRQSEHSFGATEMALNSANIGALSFSIALNSHWRFKAGVENLFDEHYFASADALSTLAIGREFNIGFHYR